MECAVSVFLNFLRAIFTGPFVSDVMWWTILLVIFFKKTNVYMTKQTNKLLQKYTLWTMQPTVQKNLFYLFNKVTVQIISIDIVLLNMDAILFKCCSILMHGL